MAKDVVFSSMKGIPFCMYLHAVFTFPLPCMRKDPEFFLDAEQIRYCMISLEYDTC